MSARERNDRRDNDGTEMVGSLVKSVQRRVATVGIAKVAEESGLDPDTIADFIFGATDGKSPDLVSLMHALHDHGFTLAPLDGAVVEGHTLRDLVYGALASLEATKEELRHKFGGDLVDEVLRAGINRDDGVSVIGKIVELQNELSAMREKLDAATAASDAMKPAAGKSRTTMIRVIGGLVQAIYKIDIQSDRLSGIGVVLRDLETVGVTLDESTLRDYLREAAKKIDSSAKSGD
ncbi:hypothetical protein LGM85_13840 [Burkholderia multivorans]|uniref:hypothetical protein n=1 Tax=Burkholderia multivorans TaxID=87883 RepID=UPI001C26E7A4|nr:hypothetical protein [Burkholderia multivorans]MBU9598363.1 hypothetical protein [Burkholderia multivorans]MCA8485015.1 hypothetical protein [Burkholderia multivorans]